MTLRALAVGAYALIWTPLSLGAAAAVWSAFPHVGFVEELTVSLAIYLDQNKLRDLFFFPAALALQAIGWIALWAALARAARDAPRESARETARFETLARLAPFAVFVAAVPIGAVSWMGAAALLAGIALISWSFDDEWRAAAEQVFVVAAAGAVAANNALGAPTGPAFVGAFVGAAALAWIARGPHAFLRTLYAAAFAVVAGAAALHAPGRWLPAASVPPFSALDLVFYAIAALAFAISAAGLVRRRGMRLPAPPALLLALALLLLGSGEPGGLVIPTDDYHFGESLVAADAVLNGEGLFAGVLPAHGLVDVMGWVVGALGGDATAAGVVWGEQTAKLLARLALLWTLIAVLPRPYGLLLGLATPIAPPAETLALMFLALIVAAGARPRAMLAGALAVAASAGAIFAVGGVGVAVAVAAFAMTAIARLPGPRRALGWFALGTILCAIAVALLFRREVAEWLWYLLVSAKTNATVYGAAYSNSFVNLAPASLIVVHSFVGVASISFLSAVAVLPRTAFTAKGFLRVLFMVAPLAMLGALLNGYAFGRIDPGAPRALAASLISAVALALWAHSFKRDLFGDRIIKVSTALACALLLLITQRPESSLGWRMQSPIAPPHAALMPMAARLAAGDADDDGLRIGAARMDAAHKANILAIGAVVDAVLSEHGTLANLTNRSVLSYYLARPPGGPVTSAYNAAPRAFQEETLARWREDPPDLFIVNATNIEHDGFRLPLRAHRLYRFLIESYEPFTGGGRIFAVRRGAPTPPTQRFALPAFSDVNWSNGVAIGANAARWSFFVPDFLRDALRPGDILDFSDGVRRTVASAEGLNVRIDGPPLKPAVFPPHAFIVRNRSIDAPSPELLWRAAFDFRDLQGLPSAWGRSLDLLEGEIEPTAPKAFDAASVHAVAEKGEGVFTIAGEDAMWRFTPAGPIDPARDGLLKLDIACLGAPAPPHVQVFWRRRGERFSERDSVVFIASHNVNLVPLDASPGWLLSPSIAEIRIDVNGPADCKRVRLASPMLYRRRM